MACIRTCMRTMRDLVDGNAIRGTRDREQRTRRTHQHVLCADEGCRRVRTWACPVQSQSHCFYTQSAQATADRCVHPAVITTGTKSPSGQKSRERRGSLLQQGGALRENTGHTIMGAPLRIMSAALSGSGGSPPPPVHELGCLVKRKRGRETRRMRTSPARTRTR